MPDSERGVLSSATDGGVTAKHPDAEQVRLLVAPATANELNTARLRLIPIACFRIDDIRFKFDSSFVLPDVRDEMNAFAELRKLDPRIADAPISIFGHADPSFQGNFEPGSSTAQSGDDYNKTLSGRRAIAIYGLLVRDASIWNTLFTNHLGGDVWGEDSIRTMLDVTDPPDSSQSISSAPSSSNPGAADSARSAKVRDVANDVGQRQRLFLAYMDALCQNLKLDKTKDFLARGAGPDHKGDVQGCSRFNPLRLFSIEDEARFKQAFNDKDETTLKGDRDVKNGANRRVMILIFRKGSQVLPARWPCPTFKEGPSACKKRFWSDGDTRRSTHFPGSDHKFKGAKDTFACRFYQRLVDVSPCEEEIDFWVIRLLEAAPTPINERRPLANLPFSVTGVGGEISQFQGTTDSNGVLRIPVRDNPAVMQLLVAGQQLTVLGGSLEAIHPGDFGPFQRLSNLGFGRAELERGDLAGFVAAMQKFQELHGLPVEDQPSSQFLNKLHEFHGS